MELPATVSIMLLHVEHKVKLLVPGNSAMLVNPAKLPWYTDHMDLDKEDPVKWLS